MPGRPILVVEDSDEDFQTVQDAARRAQLPHPIVRASSGSDCLRQLHGDLRGRLGLVLLDLNTPGDDGREALREIRSDDRFKALPLVVLTASANPRDLQFCYAHGANAYHVKPVDHALHLQVLQQIFAYWLGSVVLPA
ncbi:response regulator [Rhizobacter sp. AJA081-3]|uniref:response regulator n=1 Tax=Rhizobacter sp. AJA081-3 TaxID=2753607 RepID=UPI001AE061CE|nr:response regulator [Rhizobacter sp. AJA081-3]QTN22636.1 response regulator [Rhizobacter sp. AJA081-3]